MALSDSLVAYWSLDEASGSALDAVGTNDLTDNNTVGSAAGLVGNARDFESTNSESFSHADNAVLSTGDIDFTISAWVNFESLGADRAIASHWGGSGNQSFILFYRQNSSTEGGITAGSRLELFLRDGAATIGRAVATTFGAPPLSTWLHVVAWHDATNNLCGIAIDGGTADTRSTTGSPADSAGQFVIGGIGGSGTTVTSFMDGLIDEVGLWKRVLTADERTDLYNSGSGRDYAYITAAAGGGTTTGTAASTSGATGTLTGTGALSGTSATTSGATGTLADGTSPTLSGTAATVSGATATLSGIGALVGSSPIVSNAVATLRDAIGHLTGSPTSTSKATGTLRAFVPSAEIIPNTSLAGTWDLNSALLGSWALDSDLRAIWRQNDDMTGRKPS